MADAGWPAGARAEGRLRAVGQCPPRPVHRRPRNVLLSTSTTALLLQPAHLGAQRVKADGQAHELAGGGDLGGRWQGGGGSGGGALGQAQVIARRLHCLRAGAAIM